MTLLRDRVEALRGQWLLTVNDSPFTRRLFRRHRMEAVTTQNRAVNNAEQPGRRFGELIIRPRGV
jgi:hypothetical protein